MSFSNMLDLINSTQLKFAARKWKISKIKGPKRLLFGIYLDDPVDNSYFPFLKWQKYRYIIEMAF